LHNSLIEYSQIIWILMGFIHCTQSELAKFTDHKFLDLMAFTT